MSLLRRWHIFLLSAALLATPALAIRSHRSPTAHRHYVHHRYYHHHYVRHYVYGQRGMTPDRVTQIQAALIQKHYLTGDPNGQWDAKTQDAMRKFQADHGWQTKLMPDARAIIALGLGPKTDETHMQTAKEAKQPQPNINYADTLAAVQIVPR
ncbi:MAG: peptidoglycan-binding domain-containing protein [Acidobacteriaceae bacterium]